MELFLATKTGTPIIGQIASVMGWIMDGIYKMLDGLFGIQNIGLCIIIFSILIFAFMTPLQIKQQKFSKLSAIMQPEIQKIQKKYQGKKDQASMMKMNEETQAVYQKYGVSPTGSCVQLAIQMPILFALYQVIYRIPAYVGSVKNIFTGVVDNLLAVNGYTNILQQFITDHSMTRVRLVMDSAGNATSNSIVDFLYALSPSQWKELAQMDQFSGFSDAITKASGNISKMQGFCGLNIADQPLYYIMEFFKNHGSLLLAIVALLIPVLAWATQMLNLKLMPQAATPAGIAILHSAFNVTATLVLLPFGKWLEKLACLTIRDKKEETETAVAADPDFMILESRFLEKPSFAVEQSRNAAKKMAEDSHRTLFTALDLLKHFSADGKKAVEESEKKVDRYEDELGTYLVKLNQKDLSVHDSHSISIMLHCIGDFERISDHGVNIMESAQELHEKGLKFSEKALEELRVMEHAVEDIVDIAYKVYENQDVQLAREIEPLEEVIDELSKELKYRHIQRLRAGECTIEMGFILSDVTTSLERVADHCSNIGVCVTQVHEDAFDTHQHLKQIKHGPDETFYRALEVIRSQYQLPEIKDEPAAAQMAAAGSQ